MIHIFGGGGIGRRVPASEVLEYVFEDFEDEMYVIQYFDGGGTAMTPGDYGYWKYSHRPEDASGDQRPGYAYRSTDQARYGTTSLRVEITTTPDAGANSAFPDYVANNPDGYLVRDLYEAETGGTWETGRINRMEVWMLLPTEMAAPTAASDYDDFKAAGQYTHMGTYINTAGTADDEDGTGGGHFYHYAALGYSGCWEKVIYDMHPSTERGASGGTEQNNWNDDAGNGTTYFDNLTRHYWQYTPDVGPLDGFWDHIRFYEESRTENEEQVYTLHGVFVPSTNELRIGWLRNKDEDAQTHSVRYAFSDIHDLGWDNATAAPSGTSLSPPGVGGYNGMGYITTAIDVSGQDTIYVAIKPDNSALFKQISLPLSGHEANSPWSSGNWDTNSID